MSSQSNSLDNMSVGTNKTMGTFKSASGKSTKSNKSETVNYLLLYENMVRHQDLEFEATADHIKLTVERVKWLGRKKTPAGDVEMVNEVDEENNVPEGMLTYLQMRRCLLRLGYTWNRSLPPAPQTPSYYDDDVSVASVLSGGSGSQNSGNSGFGSTRDIIATDAQLIMLLTTLVEMEERHTASKLGRMVEGIDEKESDEEGNFHRGLFLPEFIQAYKLIIGGMQALVAIPNPEESSSKPKSSYKRTVLAGELAALRNRSRERTLGLIRLFGPDASLYKAEFSDVDGVAGNQAAGEAPRQNQNTLTPNRSNKKRSLPIATHNSKSSRPNISTTDSTSYRSSSIQPKDGLLPRLSEEQIRKLVHSKDAALAKILEEHESEMNLMASNMEEMKQKELRTQIMLKKRKKKLRTGMMVLLLGMLILIIGGGVWEYKREILRREEVEREILLGREEERKKDATTIKNLQDEVKELRHKLSDAEATIRYEEGRYETMKNEFDEIKLELEEMEVKWLMDQGELERCRIKRKELEIDLNRENEKNVEVEEEVEWCRKRLESADRNLDSMEREMRMMKSKKLGGGIASSKGVNVAAETSVDNDERGLALKSEDGEILDVDEKVTNTTTNSKVEGIKTKPVQLEMKYNKSFRHAVILRQTYSAIGGMAFSIFIQGLIPGLGRLMSILFFK